MPAKLTQEQFIDKAKQIHGDKYDYSLVEYILSNVKVKIICKKHGVWEQKPNCHLSGRGCSKCKIEFLASLSRSNKEEFIQKANKIHNNKYDYSLVEYINSYTKVKIICKEHGIFEQTPHKHLQDRGCPRCKRSKGEEQTEKILIENNINYILQKWFNDCRGKKRPLPFDFYLPDYNTLIEFQGEQHYREYHKMGGIEKLLQVQEHDRVKKDYCKKNNINLLEIKYNDNIEKKIKGFLIDKYIKKS